MTQKHRYNNNNNNNNNNNTKINKNKQKERIWSVVLENANLPIINNCKEKEKAVKYPCSQLESKFYTRGNHIKI